MSHFALGIIVPKNVVEENNIDEYINEKMEKFDENKSMEPYIRLNKSKSNEYLIEEIKKYESKYDEIKSLDKETLDKYNPKYIEHIPKKLKELKNMEPNEYWTVLTEHENFFDKKGNVLSQYNPNSKWDWFVIGGRWDGHYTDNYQFSDNGFNFGENHHTKNNNMQTIKEYKERYSKDSDTYSMFAYLDIEGNWLERGNMGWWGMVSDEKDEKNYNKLINNFLNKQNEEDYIINIDCHI